MNAIASSVSPFNWPALKHYRAPYLDRIVLPVGGIGTGTVGLAGNGALRDWEIMNNPAKGYVPSFKGQLKTPSPSLLLRFQEAGGEPRIKLLEGPLPFSSYEGPEGSLAPNANLPRFQEAEFATAYPLGEVSLRDEGCPLHVRLQAYNPLLPGDVEASEWPVAFFRCVLTNTGKTTVRTSLVFSLPNFIGADGSEFVFDERGSQKYIGFKDNVNDYRTAGEVAGLHLSSRGVDPSHPAWGTISLSTPSRSGISYRTSWADLDWGNTLLDFWDDLLDDGRLGNRTASHPTPMASLCVEQEIAPGETVGIPFLLAWHFPNRLGWRNQIGTGLVNGEPSGSVPCGDRPIGNFYTTRFTDAWAVAEAFWPEASRLERETLCFVEAYLKSDAPPEIQEAALFNLSTIRTQTCFRAADGRFFAWEGIFDRGGSCWGSCTHVWNYEQGLGLVFPELAKSMHRTSFLTEMDERGMMPCRIPLALAPNSEIHRMAVADGQAGHIVRVFREWLATGDEIFFQEMWPAVRKAIAFCWIPGGWDADQDGVMEGCQHNTMDVEYYGPNPQMTGWYLAALDASSRMARHAGDDAFADRCRALYEQGRAWMDAHLFNGEYYEQHIRPPASLKDIAPTLRFGDVDLKYPASQLGAGCLIDQLIGEWAARLAGLAPILHGDHVRATLRSILRYNGRSSMRDHFNHLRSYAIGDEAAVIMASYPRGNRPARPFPYYNEVMTGFEHVLAGHLLIEGFDEEGLRCVQDIRARYDGLKRNPYSEAECGHHYGRTLASWGLLAAWSGFAYNAVEQTLSLGRVGTYFWSCGAGWGMIRVEESPESLAWQVHVERGTLSVALFRFQGREVYHGPVVSIRPGKDWESLSSCPEDPNL